MVLLEKPLHVQGRLRFDSGESTPRPTPPASKGAELRARPAPLATSVGDPISAAGSAPIASRTELASAAAPRSRRLIKLSDIGRADAFATPPHAAELDLERLPAVRSPLMEVLGTLLVVASLLFVAAYI